MGNAHIMAGLFRCLISVRTILAILQWLIRLSPILMIELMFLPSIGGNWDCIALSLWDHNKIVQQSLEISSQSKCFFFFFLISKQEYTKNVNQKKRATPQVHGRYTKDAKTTKKKSPHKCTQLHTLSLSSSQTINKL